ncbi:related to DUG3 - probable glutamine amidotransferase [Melanopsichium pennsylvanicum]|uniref:Related to DUG3 - probable glutamine amidotransferase n=1 Tax=Melanopsichium pennsylvanicum TaxID=63383 RepID=A0AAJ4XKJ2_9BASI|nr:related to DUG3 - probable glutamine amidotransferase [Melanopsichium pennsylvanicum]
MCRLLVFKGTQPIQLCHLVTRPAHSIINQAFDSRLRLDATRAVNGDGFGVGWYDSSPDLELGNAPCIFTSVTPAWNNQNLCRIAEKIKSPLVFAHVRASTAGALSETNCHPWRYGRLMWMHNGQISDFGKIKRRVLESLNQDLFLFPQGHTDSEFAFAVFLSHLENPLQTQEFGYKQLRKAMLDTINDFNNWSRQAGIVEPSLMNFCVTDGQSIICTRYVSSKTDQAASLYFSSGTSFYEHTQGTYRMVKTDKREKIIVVASEPLTFEKADWMEIPTNTLVVVTAKMNVLMMPITDEYAIQSGEQGLVKRDPQFALGRGFPPSMNNNNHHNNNNNNPAVMVQAQAQTTLNPINSVAPAENKIQHNHLHLATAQPLAHALRPVHDNFF